MSKMMIKAPAVSRAEIDAWPVSESGLPARVVHCAANMRIETLGELRRVPDERLLAERRFGRRSLVAVEDFFKFCARLEAGKVGFADLRKTLEYLLPAKSLEVLTARYGLDRREMEASRNYSTLQQIANRDGLTRERVRQVIETAVERLHSRLARACLRPYEDMIVAEIQRHGGMADADDLACFAGQPAFGGLNPAAASLLLCDAHPEHWAFFGHVFVLAPLSQVQAFSRAVRHILRRASRPVSRDEMLDRVGALPANTPPRDRHAYVSKLIEQMEDVLQFKDGSALAVDRLPLLLEAFMQEAGGKATYATLAGMLNERLLPYCRRSSQSVHRWLTVSGRFQNSGRPGEYLVRGRPIA